MLKKTFGRTNIEVGIVGLGTGTLGIPHQNLERVQYSNSPNWKNQIDRELGVRTVVAGLDAGIRYIDTAPWYGRGVAEEMIGKALKERPGLRGEVIVATKIGHLRPGDDYDFSYDAAMRSFEGSQKRLGIERFRIVHLHDPMGQSIDQVMGDQGVFGAMRKLQGQGLIDFIGVGSNDPVLGAKYVATGKFDAAIVVGSWSILNQSALNHIIPKAARWDTGLIAANAIERGILASGFHEDLVYNERRFSPELIARVGEIQSICKQFGIPMSAAAIQWCVRDPRVAMAIPGARTPEQALENAAAGAIEIPAKFWEKLNPLIETWDCVEN
jgi:D-threo-aldose 1-dehydrogenase